MTNTITLTASMRSNLSSLKSLATQMSTTQTRLSTGKKVNSAIDNASSYYQARALTNRAADLDSLLDSMGQSIQTITAASEAIDSGLSLIEQMKSVAQSAIGNIDNLPQIRQAGSPLSNISPMFDGRSNTQAIVDQIGKKGLAAYACNQFYAPGVSADDENFGQGKWYLPSIGELMDAYGEYEAEYYKSQFVYLKHGDNDFYDFIEITEEEFNASKDKMVMYSRNTNTDELTITELSRAEATQLFEEHGSYQYSDGDNEIQIGFAVRNEPQDRISISQEEYDALPKYYKVEEDGSGPPHFEAITQEEYEQFIIDHNGNADDINGIYTTVITIEDLGGGVNLKADGENKAAIKDTLSLLASQGSKATTLSNGAYWSSSEIIYDSSWFLLISNGERGTLGKYSNGRVRAFQLLENCFTPLSLSSDAVSPQIGDVMYSDLSYSDKDHINTSKTAVGVVTWVSDDGASARIMSLKDLTFSSTTQVGNFAPANPYGGAQVATSWCTYDKYMEDITGVDNIEPYAFASLYLSADHGSGGTDIADFSAYTEQFNAIYSQYDAMVKDASYQGINLLNGGNLNVMFNETRTHSHQVEGYHADAAALGINTAAWSEATDIEATITQLQNATSRLRNIAGDLGNHLSIIETRQDFTDNLIDVLETGADNLVLADMNEESANYLALQTRQQLAVNSLSLASQSAQSVLSLF